MVISVVCFAASFGAASGSMELSDLGPVGVFTAMFSAIAGTRLFYLFLLLDGEGIPVPFSGNRCGLPELPGIIVSPAFLLSHFYRNQSDDTEAIPCREPE